MGTLSQIITELERTEGCVALAQVAKRLDIEPSALEGMIQFLVRKGRLREVEFGAPACAACATRSGCTILQMGKAYELVRP